MKEKAEQERYIASLLHKEPIRDGIVLYTFVNTIIGYYDEESGIFIDDQDREYSAADTDGGILNPDQFVCGNIMTLDEAYDKYSDKKSTDINDLFKSFDAEEENYFYLCGINEDGVLLLLKYNYDEQLGNFYDRLKGVTDNKTNKQTTYDLISNNREKKASNSVELDKTLIDNIRNNKYTKEQLIEIKKILSNRKKGIRNIIDIAEKKIKDENYVSQMENVEMPKELLKNTALDKKSFMSDNGVLLAEKFATEINKTIISQKEAVERYSIELSRLTADRNNNIKDENDDNDNYGILLYGPTGVGKTAITHLTKKFLDLPILMVDSTQLTSPGYVGKNIEQYLWELYEDCGRDLEKTEKAIVIFGEIDKKGSERKDDVAGKGVLNVLLKFLDGTTYYAAPEKSSAFTQEGVHISTKNMIIIAEGAFTEVYANPKRSIGFNQDSSSKEYEPTPKDFAEKAMIPDEFMGRFPVMIRLKSFDVPDMIDLLNTSNRSPILLQKRKFKSNETELEFTDEAKEKIAIKAKNFGTNARGLSGVVAEATAMAYKEANSGIGKYDKFIITGKTIDDNKNYEVKLKNKNKSQEVKTKQIVKKKSTAN